MSVHKTILIINPNSNQAVTDGISDAVDAFRLPGGPTIECMTLAEGPFGVESQADVDSVALPLSQVVAARDDVDAFVIACYSDPGIHVCREATDKPVFGIQESAMLAAASLGDRFGVLAIADASIKRHLRYLRQLGLIDRLANERPINLSVAETAEGDATFDRLMEVGAELRDQDRADVVVLGCAGMAKHRARLQDGLGIPVVDPCQAAATLALGAVLLSS
jgi:Asp/Glu/hydantoin racemase